MPFLGSFRQDKKSISCRKRTKMCQCINHVAHFWQCKHGIFIQCCSIISTSYACANAEKIFPGGREGGVWRILDYTCISFWCRATDLQLLKRELNFAIKILFILLVDRQWKPTVSLAHLLTEDQLADFFSRSDGKFLLYSWFWDHVKDFSYLNMTHVFVHYACSYLLQFIYFGTDRACGQVFIHPYQDNKHEDIDHFLHFILCHW